MPENLSWPLPKQSRAVGPVSGCEAGYKIRPDVDNLHLAFYRLVPTNVGAEDKGEKEYLEALIDRWDDIRDEWDPSSSPLAATRKRREAQRKSLAEAGRATRSLKLETEGRLAAGLGYDSPMEVGMSLHPLHGFPYLPGTAVKGVARAYAEHIVDADAETLLRVFGSTSLEDPDPERRRGLVTFMDALPTSPPELELDVMTPHHTAYHSGDSEELPGAWQAPNPVSFLTVAGGTPFEFSLAAESEELLQQAATWLKQGLFWLGAGGKTSSGYGLFTSEARRQEAAERRSGRQETEEEQNGRPDATEEGSSRRLREKLPPKKESIGKNTNGILAYVVGPTQLDNHAPEAKLDVVLHVEGYEEMGVPMTGSDINIERFEADWVKVRVERFLTEKTPLVRFESKWSP